MPALSDWPDMPGPDRPTTLDTDTQAFFDHLKETFTPEVNALADYLANAARPAFSVMAVFDGAATSDADPGAGNWRLNSATQNAATYVYADLADANGADMTAIIEAMDDSTSSTKGWLRFSVNGDRTKWLLAKITGAVVTATGYRKIPITMIASSATSPIADNAEITVAFTPNGDKGDLGSFSNDGSLVTVSGTPSMITLSSLPVVGSIVKFDLNIVPSTTAILRGSFSLDGSSYSTAYDLTASLSSFRGSIIITDYRGNNPQLEGRLHAADLVSRSAYTVTENPRFSLAAPGGLAAFRLSLSTGTFNNGGTIQRRVM